VDSSTNETRDEDGNETPTSNYWGRQPIVALGYQIARDIEMVDIGPQWIYDYADMLVYVL